MKVSFKTVHFVVTSYQEIGLTQDESKKKGKPVANLAKDTKVQVNILVSYLKIII